MDVNVLSAVAMPVFVQGRAAGVFFLRTVQGDPQLRSQDVAFANTIAQAAARVLENEERRAATHLPEVSAGGTRPPPGCGPPHAVGPPPRPRRQPPPPCSLRRAVRVLDG